MIEPIRTTRLCLRLPTERDAAPLATLLAQPEVARWWRDWDEARVRAELIAPDDDLTVLVIEYQGRVAGVIQFSEESDPEYRHAGIDLFLDAACHGQGLGSEAIRGVVEHLFAVRGHHRLVIDPAADNSTAIRAYERVGFRRVGVMRQYERGADGSWHDGLLMELLADDHVVVDTQRE